MWCALLHKMKSKVDNQTNEKLLYINLQLITDDDATCETLRHNVGVFERGATAYDQVDTCLEENGGKF